jgi:hypothetical protein
MVSAIPNPALDAFVEQLEGELVFAQALVRVTAEGYELRHVEDREARELQCMNAEDLRHLAQFTASKLFRPLKSAPTLQRGWCFRARNTTELEFALQCLYPGAIADWFAARQPEPPVTHYREFTARQTGMYRITTMLTDAQVAHVARAGCHKRFCLKQRLWTVTGLEPDAREQKSAIPCLEPCAVLLEFARTAVRLEQREKQNVGLAPDELRTCLAGLECLASAPRADLREADFAASENPRRAQLLIEKLQADLESKAEHENE